MVTDANDNFCTKLREKHESTNTMSKITIKIRDERRTIVPAQSSTYMTK